MEKEVKNFNGKNYQDFIRDATSKVRDFVAELIDKKFPEELGHNKMGLMSNIATNFHVNTLGACQRFMDNKDEIYLFYQKLFFDVIYGNIKDGEVRTNR